MKCLLIKNDIHEKNNKIKCNNAWKLKIIIEITYKIEISWNIL